MSEHQTRRTERVKEIERDGNTQRMEGNNRIYERTERLATTAMVITSTMVARSHKKSRCEMLFDSFQWNFVSCRSQYVRCEWACVGWDQQIHINIAVHVKTFNFIVPSFSLKAWNDRERKVSTIWCWCHRLFAHQKIKRINSNTNWTFPLS